MRPHGNKDLPPRRYRVSAKHRRNFGEVFEGKVQGAGIPNVTLRRLEPQVAEKLGLYPPAGGNMVGVFHGEAPIAVIDFDDIFDQDGNRFYND